LGGKGAKKNRGKIVNFLKALQLLIWGYSPPDEMINPDFPVWIQSIGGLALTVFISLMSVICGFLVAVPLAALRKGSPLSMRRSPFHYVGNICSATVIEFVRGIPVMILVLVAFYTPYSLFGWRLPNVVLAVGVLSVYAGVYLAEAIRSGLRSFSYEFDYVGRVLGLTRGQILITIQLPLVFRAMLPDLINIVITIFKDTSTLSIVAIPELTYVGRQLLMSRPAEYAVILGLTLVLYWLPSSILSYAALRAEVNWSERSSLLSNG
jgi:His/Glu/Gln/Arg/opine family amino acid ABC transporter permease subunit